jgi:site-specific DNA-adenine methylase
MNNKIQALIIQYENKLTDKKRLQEHVKNDIVEGLIYAYEDIIKDLKKLLYSIDK